MDSHIDEHVFKKPDDQKKRTAQNFQAKNKYSDATVFLLKTRKS